ncbi:thyroid adenoma-associated protein homolog [Argonauta hians]
MDQHHLEIARTKVNENPELQKIIKDYAISVWDVLHAKPVDRHTLTKEIEASSKILRTHIQDSEECHFIQDYTTAILACYIACIETSSLARCFKKLLEPIPHSMLMEEISYVFLSHLSSDTNMTSSTMGKFGHLIEQCAEVQPMIVESYPQICNVLHRHIALALNMSTTSDLLYSTVKTSLVLFQHFPQQTKIHLSLQVNDTSSPLTSVVQSLLAVLAESKCSSETVLLAGTAYSMMLSSLPCNPVTVCSIFWSSLTILNQHRKLLSWEQILRNSAGFMNKSPHLGAIQCDKFGCLSLVRGFLSSVENSFLLLEELTEGTNMTVPLIIRFSFTIYEMCKSIMLPYHSFNLLHIWYSRYLRLLPNLYIQNSPGFSQHNREIIEKQSLELIWLHWDSPVEGVSDTVSNIFHIMCQIWHVERSSGSNDGNALLQELLHKLIALPWYVKGKYKMMASLLQFLKYDNALSSLEQVKSQLVRCMATNHLVSSASEVYRVYMTKLALSKEAVSIWDQDWRNILLDGLANEDELMKRNVCHYWLPTTLKFIPQCGQHLSMLLTGALSPTKHPQLDLCHKLDLQSKWSHAELLHMLIMVSLTMRNLSGTIEWNEHLLREALCSDCVPLRLDTLTLLCSSAKKAEMLHSLESKLLIEALPVNLNIDSAPFRQNLVSVLKKLLIRIRDSCCSMMKTQNLSSVEHSIKFVDWLHRLCSENLVPGSNFQRRKMCLEILKIIKEVFVLPDLSTKRKSFIDSLKRLIIFAQQEKELWDFTSSSSFVSILLCLLDGADEVRELAADILEKFFDWSPKHLSSSKKNIPAHLLSEALCLCNSPRHPDCLSGSLLCKLVFCKVITDQKRYFTIHSVSRMYEVEETPPSELPCTLYFMRSLLKQIELGLSAATVNPVVASKEKSLHGLICCIEECLPYCIESMEDNEVKAWQSVLEYIVNLAIRIINVVMCILSGGQDSAGCPSFADIAVALENVICDSQSTYQTSVVLSNEYQFLLSWCWINLKESSSLLGQIVNLVNKKQKKSSVPSQNLFLSFEVYQKISDIFIKVLTQCRHRGAIENCRSGFTDFCMTLLSTSQNASSIPEKILVRILKSLNCGQLDVSVTRRSAGLPIIIQCICISERKTKNGHLMAYSMKSLFATASQPVPLLSTCEKRDLAQVHALNILKVLFGDNNLNTGLLLYISEAVKLVIAGFESPSWAIRNASTQLFSTLMTRMFGQKKIKDGCLLNAMTLEELAVHYPDLLPFLLAKLSQSKNVQKTIHIQPSLFPVLTLLSNVGASEKVKDDTVNIGDQFSVLIEPLIASRVYQMRELAASAMIAVTAPSQRHNKIIMLLHQITSTQDQHNKVHGIFIFIEKLLQSQSWNKDDLKSILQKLICLAFPQDFPLEPPSCGLIQARLIQIIKNTVLATPGIDFLGDNWSQLCTHLWQQIESTTKNNPAIGFSCLLSEHAELLLHCTTASYVAGEADSLKPVVDLLLTSTCYEVQQRCCQTLYQYLQSKKLPVTFWESVMEQFISLQLNVSQYSPIKITMLDLFNAVYLKFSDHFDNYTHLHLRTEDINIILNQLREELLSVGIGTALQSTILPSLSICTKLISTSPSTTKFEELYLMWSSYLFQQLGNVDSTLRMALSQSLAIAGNAVLSTINLLAKSISPLSQKEISYKIFHTALYLLQDDINEVRNWAAHFVHSLPLLSPLKQFSSLQSNICLKLLFHHLVCHYPSAAWDILYDLLCYNDGSECAASLEAMLSRKLQISSWQLFDQEDNYCFAEKMVVNQLAHAALIKLLSNTKPVSKREQYLSTLCTSVLHKGTILFESLSKNLKEKPLLNISCDVQVFPIIQGIFLVTNTIMDYLSQHPDAHIEQINNLKSMYTKLEKVQNLHPVMQSLMLQAV